MEKQKEEKIMTDDIKEKQEDTKLPEIDKKRVIESTEENIKQSIENNWLDRNNEVLGLCEFLINEKNLHSIAIEGNWGCGKTFFIKQSKFLINKIYQEITPQEDDGIIRQVKCLKELCKEKSPVLAVYYDAWENDNDNDPLGSLMFQIAVQTGHEMKTDEQILMCLLHKVSELTKLVNFDLYSFLKNIDDQDNILDKIEKIKSKEKECQEFFKTLPEEKAEKVIVFIDELDRCNPLFAIKLLERIKHYLVNDRIIFVFATNIQQLCCTIRKQYGIEFDAETYLDKLFDYIIPLPVVNLDSFYNFIDLPSSNLVYCSKIIEKYRLGLREILRFNEQLLQYKSKMAKDGGNARSCEEDYVIDYIIPLLIVLIIKDKNMYYDFVQGKNVTPLLELFSIFNELNDISHPIISLLNNNENYFDNTGINIELINKKINELYNAIFNKKYKRIGKVYFGQSTQWIINNFVSLARK